MKNYRLFLAIPFLLPALASFGQQLKVISAENAPYIDPLNMIRDNLAGGGIEILDVQFNGSNKAVGYFVGGDQTIGLHRGLVMTTGFATTTVGYDPTGTGIEFASNSNGSTYEEPLLNSIATASQKDVASYRITFRASADSIRFRYVFASEEYPEYACTQFNDVFGFFLEGPGIASPINIARVPGTSLPVSINNVHPYNDQNNPIPTPCFPYNAQFYHNNVNAITQPVYDGYLDVFTAEAAVQPCQVYVMTLTIADIGDSAYDTAVFLEGNSFSDDVDIHPSFEPGEGILPEIALADTVYLHFHQIPPAMLPLQASLTGTAVNGLDYLSADTLQWVTTSDTVLAFHLQPLADTLSETTESILLTVRDTGCYYRAFPIYLVNHDSMVTPLDSIVYSGGGTLLKAPDIHPQHQVAWSGSNSLSYPVPSDGILVHSDIEVTGFGDDALNKILDINMIQSVCVNIQHNFDADLLFYLFAPDGKVLELSSKNGGNGHNYTNTCFTPDATQSITLVPPASAPFTGNFQPEGQWSDLLGAPLNGVWSLGVMDNFLTIDGTLLNWSLSLSKAGLGKFKYHWNTGDTTATILVYDPGEYSVTVSNAISSLNKTFVLYTPCNVVDSIEATIHAGESYTFGSQTLTQPGIYSQTYPASNGCDSIVVLNLLLASAVHEPGAEVQFSPNPSNGETVINLGQGAPITRIRVFDMTGRRVLDKKGNGTTSCNLKTAGWKPGWYLVEVENQEGTRMEGRLLVK